ncbi:LysM peptidoglycan-binding domain-containing protein [Lysinibacillus telephonicus]|uniref:LysM peptidoglycan-binding domain-containing protein n=1 Tax=Lysinibacillus telephonicus TaxID=1714840 RepID=UPI003BA00449
MIKKMMSIVPLAALTLTVSANVQAATITVQKGDTLWDLARANNSSVENIQAVNHLTTDLIHPVDILTIAPEKQYTVKQGDTLWDIAIAYQVTVSQIKEWNQLHTDLIHPGLNLVIFEGLKNSESAKIPAVHAPKESTPESKAPSNEALTQSTPKTAAPAANNEISQEEAPKATAPAKSNETSEKVAPKATTPAESNKAAQESTSEATAPAASSTGSKVITVEATAYTASCEGCSGITSTGINLKENPDAKVISVDPSVIPLGSKVYVEGYGEAIAGDTGGSIKGNKIDVFIPSKQDAADFGVKQLKVTILD